MIQVGTIGSSWITSQFIDACKLDNKFEVKTIYSRSEERAREFALECQVPYYTDDLEGMLSDRDVQLVYIASPNHMHYEQAMKAMRHGKHLIIEKPMFSNLEEWHSAHKYAESMDVKIFEAAKHIHGRNYRRLKELVNHQMTEAHLPFMGANFNLGQYSSRYEEYRRKEKRKEPTPNVFNPKTSGGTLMDLGVYPIYVAIDLFDLPKEVSYQTIKGADQSDLFGSIQLKYDGFLVNMFISKAVHSILPSEIYFDNQTLVVYNMTKISKVDLVSKEGQQATLINYKPKNTMSDQLEVFYRLIKQKNEPSNQEEYEYYVNLSKKVHEVMSKLKRSAGLIE